MESTVERSPRDVSRRLYVCDVCGVRYVPGKASSVVCSRDCSAERQRRTPGQRGDQRSPLAKAFAASDAVAVLAAVEGSRRVDEDGCWHYLGPRSGKPVANFTVENPDGSRKLLAVSRAVGWAVFGDALGDQRLYKSCEKPGCVRPDHLTLQNDSLVARIARDEYVGVVEDLKARCDVDASGCWVWGGTVQDTGYPILEGGFEGKKVRRLVHRIVARAVFGDLGRQQVHHVCASRACINPGHLQVTSARENVAEMLERRWYRLRIAALESRLREVSPNDLLLAEVGLVDRACLARE